MCVRVDPMDTQMSNTSYLLVAALCSSLLIIILLLCVICLIYQRVRRVASIKTSCTAVIALPPSSPHFDFSLKLHEIDSGYSGSGSGVL